MKNSLDPWNTLLERTRPGQPIATTPVPERVVALAERNRVIPCLARTLAADDMSETAVRLRLIERASALRALRLSAEMSRIAVILEKAGTPGVFLKGVSLANDLHGSIAARHPGDIDVIVEESRAIRAAAALIEAGFVPVGTTMALFEGDISAFMLERHKDAKFLSPSQDVEVELHWRSTEVPWLDTDLYGGASGRDMSGIRIHVPDPVDHALYLCAHGALHLWARLKWLQDLRVLFYDASWIGEDWDALAQRAAARNLEPVLGSTALLVSWIDDRPVPLPLRDMCKRPRIQTLARTLQCRMTRYAGQEAENGPESIRGIFRQVDAERIRGRLSDAPGRWKRELAARFFFRGTVNDVRTLPALRHTPRLVPLCHPFLALWRCL